MSLKSTEDERLKPIRTFNPGAKTPSLAANSIGRIESIATGYTTFGREYLRFQGLREYLNTCGSADMNLWLVGVGGGSGELYVDGKRTHMTAPTASEVKNTLAGIVVSALPALEDPVSHLELKYVLSGSPVKRIYAQDIDGVNINSAARLKVPPQVTKHIAALCAKPDEYPMTFVTVNTMSKNGIAWSMSLDARNNFLQYAGGFQDYYKDKSNNGSDPELKFHHGDIRRFHPSSEPPDVIVCHNAFRGLHVARELDPVIKALKIGGVISLGRDEYVWMKLQPIIKVRYGLKKIETGLYKKTRGPVEVLPESLEVRAKVENSATPATYPVKDGRSKKNRKP